MTVKGPWRSPVKCQPTFPDCQEHFFVHFWQFLLHPTQNYNTVLEKGCHSRIDCPRKSTSRAQHKHLRFRMLRSMCFKCFFSPYTSAISCHSIRTFHSFHKLFLPGQVLQQRSKVLMVSSSKKGRFIDFVAWIKELQQSKLLSYKICQLGIGCDT